MKPMVIKVIKFDLRINGIKVTNLQELQDNLTDEINAYAIKGVLARWLRVRQLNEEADKVQQAVDEFNQSADPVSLFIQVCAAIGVEVHPDDAAILFADPPPAGQRLPPPEAPPPPVPERTLELRLDDQRSLVLRADAGSDNKPAWLTSEPIAGWQTPGPIYEDQYGLYAEFSVKGVVQRCRWIPTGTFLMGSPGGEPQRFGDEEGPQHLVTLSGYWLADTACTQALWQAVMSGNPSHFKDSTTNPVENVSWDDTQEFFNRLNRLVPGLAAGLPSEAQWEYACRAGTTTPFSFGQNITPALVNYNGNYPYANGSKGKYREKTVPVASLSTNPWGLYEMHGNVWEWCSDWNGAYAATAQRNPEGPPSGSSRVLRGGSWSYNGRFARSASRYDFVPGYRDISIGVRVAPGRAGSAEPTASR